MQQQNNPVPHPEPTPPELYPGHARDLARQAQRIASTTLAHANPLPGPLLDAFVPTPTTVGHFTVRPLVHYDFAILRKINSPLIKQLEAAALAAEQRRGTPTTTADGDPGFQVIENRKSKIENPQTPFTDEDAYEMIFIFTRPCRQAAADLARLGREAFKQHCIETIGMDLSITDLALLAKAVEREFVRGFSTSIAYESARPTDQGDGTVFTPPPVSPTTALAGGSTTSAASPAPSPR